MLRVRRRAGHLALAALAVAFSAACSGPGTITACQAADGIELICDLQNPEDLAALRGTPWVLVSQLSVEGVRPGSLIAIHARDLSRRQLVPTGESPLQVGVADWGAADCPGPPALDVFAPHGIALGTRPDGATALGVVNHGGREAIELFDVRLAAALPQLVWRGCVPLPDDASGNDLVLLPGGGLIVTNMMSRGGLFTMLRGTAAMMLGANTGRLLEWQHSIGWRAVPGGDGAAPNGVALSADGSHLFFGEWAASRLVRVARTGPRAGQPERIELDQHPDNLSWSRAGRLLVAGQRAPIGEVMGCLGLVTGNCDIPFSVIEVDPITLESRTLLEHGEGEAVAGAASAALEVGNELWVGTFAGDRIARTVLEPHRLR